MRALNRRRRGNAIARTVACLAAGVVTTGNTNFTKCWVFCWQQSRRSRSLGAACSSLGSEIGAAANFSQAGDSATAAKTASTGLKTAQVILRSSQR